MSDSKITAVIPVRAGSRRLPNKNILPFANSNLLTNKIQQLKKVKAIDVITAAKTADRNTITDVRIFDLYEGENLPESKKSIAISVTFQPQEKTFSDQELDVLMKKVEMAVCNKTGGQLRS